MDWADILLEAARVAVGVQAAAYAIAAIGLNLQFGFTGLLNFGQVGFFLVGAYGAAITLDAGSPLWLAVIVGTLAAVVFGLLLGLPTLRLRADYLAIVTIAAAEILRLVARSNTAADLTGGVYGIIDVGGEFHDLNPIPTGVYGIGGFVFSSRSLWVILVAWLVAVLCALLVWALVRSPWGRLVRSIREDEDAARSLGKNVFLYKVQSLVLGGVFGAFAGVILLINSQSVGPDFFIPVVTFFAYTALILGGTATIFGPLVGSMVFWFFIQLTESTLREAIQNDVITFLTVQDAAALRFALVGVLLMLLMVFRPQGLFGKREEMLLDVH